MLRLGPRPLRLACRLPGGRPLVLLAELAKTTWLLLFPVWPALWLVWAFSAPLDPAIQSRRSQALQLTCLLLLGIASIDVGYGGERVFRPLGRFRFTSQTLGGDVDAEIRCRQGANRFQGTWLEALPVPLPENYVLGLDIQKRDFEAGLYSYLRGQWRTDGWWSYYVYACAVKTPLGTLLLLSLAAGLSIWPRFGGAGWRNETVLLGPPVAIFLLVSFQTGINHHARYVLPALPFLFIFASKVVKPGGGQGKLLGCITGLALAASIASSMSVYPHSLSYFNELVGGPRRGPQHLLGGNVDWGQDILYLRSWYRDHPLARPLHLAHAAYFDPVVAGLPFAEPPVDPNWRYLGGQTPASGVGPHPGWHAVSVNRLHDWTDQYAYFRRFQPLVTVGYSIHVYHLTLDDANRVRRELGLPELP